MEEKTKKEINNLAVLIIDMQKSFLDEPELKDLIPQQIEVIRFCRQKSIPVILVEYRVFGRTVMKLRKEVCPSLTSRVTKRYDDAFYETRLKKVLSSMGITNLLLAGVYAGGCVYETAAHAIEEGFQVLTSCDLIAGYCDTPLHNEAWYQENGKYFLNYQDVLSLIN